MGKGGRLHLGFRCSTVREVNAVEDAEGLVPGRRCRTAEVLVGEAVLIRAAEAVVAQCGVGGVRVGHERRVPGGEGEVVSRCHRRTPSAGRAADQGCPGPWPYRLWTCGEYRGACAPVPARSSLLDVCIMAALPGTGDWWCDGTSRAACGPRGRSRAAARASAAGTACGVRRAACGVRRAACGVPSYRTMAARATRRPPSRRRPAGSGCPCCCPPLSNGTLRR